MISHLAVCRLGYSLSAVGGHLNVTRPSIARALLRSESVFAVTIVAEKDFLDA